MNTKTKLTELLKPLSHHLSGLDPTMIKGFEHDKNGETLRDANGKLVSKTSYACRVCGLRFENQDDAGHCYHDEDRRITEGVESLKGRLKIQFRETSSYLFRESQTVVKCEDLMGPLSDCDTAHKLTAEERHMVRSAFDCAICLSEDNGHSEQAEDFRNIKSKF